MVTERTSHEDIAATIYALFQAFPEREIRGHAVGTAPDDRALWLTNEENGERMAAVVFEDQQLTLNFNGQRWYHNLQTDPKQLNDLYDADNAKVLAMWDQLNPLLDALQKTFPDWEIPDRTP